METSRQRFAVLLGCFTALMSAALASAAEPSAPATPPAANIQIAPATPPAALPPPPPGAPGDVLFLRAPIVGQVQRIVGQPFNFQLAPAETGKFWLGVMCQPVPEVLRSQVTIPAETGLVVFDLVPDGPAAKAGLQRNDVLLSADGKPLADIGVLSKIVNDKGAAEVELNVLRAGKERSVKVTPWERPEGPNIQFIPEGADRQAIEQWAEQLRKMAAEGPRAVAGRPVRVRIFQPGRLLGRVEPEKPFPADLNVTVTRDANNPVKVTVKQGDQSWEVRGDELGKLPEAVRPHIESFLRNLGSKAAGASGAPMNVPSVEIPQVEIVEDSAVEGTPGTAVPPPEPAPQSEAAKPATPPSAREPGRKRALRELREQLRQMQQQLEELDK